MGPAGQPGPNPAGRLKSRRGDIQGMRALAVLLVVVYHADVALPGGFVGVDVFFVISGFVITRMLHAELLDNDTIDLKRFYLRRVRRILPALALLLGVVLVSGVLLCPRGGQLLTGRTGAAAALFSANLYLLRFGGGDGYFDVDAETNALLHTWSLSVEEQFYFIFPALLLGAWALSRRFGRTPHRSLVAALMLVIVGSFTLSLVLTLGPGPFGGIDAIADLHGQIAFYTPVTRAWEFGAGGLLALTSIRLSPWTPRILAPVATGLLAFAALAFGESTAFPGFAALVPVLATCGLIVAGEAAPMNVVSRLLASRPLQWLGDISYSWYLWHWPLIVFAAAIWPTTPGVKLAAAVLSVVPAWASYAFLENPIRFRPRPPAAATLRLAALCVCLPLLAAAVHEGGHRTIVESSSTDAIDEAMRKHADVERGCDSDVALAERGESCTWVADEARGSVLLLGDSNAGHFTEGFVEGANRSGYTAVVATNSACPFNDLVLIQDEEHDAGCRAFIEGTIADLGTREFAYVVLASASDRYIEYESFLLEDPLTGERFVSADEKADAWTAGLQRVFEMIAAPSRQVVVMNPVPKFGDWDPREQAAYRWVAAPEDLGDSRERAEVEDDRARAVAAESLAAQAVDGVDAIDVADELCSSEVCEINRDGVWLWRDGSHLSVDGSLLLADRFEAVLS